MIRQLYLVTDDVYDYYMWRDRAKIATLAKKTGLDNCNMDLTLWAHLLKIEIHSIDK
jgi:hypothetical protein